jgi:hypothetical protein
MRNILLAMALLSAAACGGKQKSAESYSTRADVSQEAFQRGMKALDEERYTEAARIFEKILVDSPAEEYDFVVMYNLGAAHEGLKNCKSAADTYKSVAKGSAGKFPRLEVLALLRLSYAYECLGQNEKVIVALMDVRRRVKHLPEDAAKSEVPARLAAAYARMGNRKEGEKYFKQALQGVKFLQVKYKDSILLADRLSESLYFMGRSHVSENEFLRNPVAQVKGLELMQLYLLQAAELGSAKWSGRAVNEILGNYSRVWNFLEKLDAPENSDPSLRVRERDKLRSDVLRETLRSVRVLRAQRIPNRQESAPVAQLFQGLEREERKLTAMINEIGPYTDLTPQAADREGLKRPGKVRASKKSPLEKNPGQSP